MFEANSAVTDLQSRWHNLSDLDRAQAIRSVIRSEHISQRQLAAALNCSESLLRHLLLAAQAKPEDRALARQGTISTRELKRRSTATTIRRTQKHHESIEFERTKASLKGCKNILEWLASERVARPYGEQIIGEVRLQFFHAEQNGRLPREAAPVDMTNAEIIRRCKPDDLESEEINYLAGYVKWLMLWVFFTMPDSRIRDQAIDLALRDQAKG